MKAPRPPFKEGQAVTMWVSCQGHVAQTWTSAEVADWATIATLDNPA